MFDINGFEFLWLAVIALVVLGPEKLPKYAADAGRFVRQLREMATEARREVEHSLGPEFKDIDLGGLNPRKFARKHLFDPDDPGLDDEDDEPPAKPRAASMLDKEPRAATGRGATRLDKLAADTPDGGAAAPRREAPATPYDPDAT